MAADHTIRIDTWQRYNTAASRFKRWLGDTDQDIEWADGNIDGTAVRYPMLLDSQGEVRLDLANAFLLWYAELPTDEQPQEALKFAQKWLMASANMARKARDIAILPEGVFNSHMAVRVASQQTRREKGEASIAACAGQSRRADHLPTFDEKSRMLHLCLSGDNRVHPNPLRVVQTGFEVNSTHATGVRGQLVRSAKYEHIWPRNYSALADGAGVNSIVMRNTRGDKTHQPGDGSHSGWLPHRNPLFCASSTLGLCMLYRFTARNEPFPSVVDDSGRSYKWLPLAIQTEGTYGVDAKKALLSYRGVDDRSQNKCFNNLYDAAGMLMVAGDAVTHCGRHAAQQEAREAGLDALPVKEALCYERQDAQKENYTPALPLEFLLCRGTFSFRANGESRLGADADCPQWRVRRQMAATVDALVNAAVPGIAREETAVAAIPTHGKSAKKQKKDNADSHVREHQHFLTSMRDFISLAIISAAARPRKQDGTIDFDAPSLIEQHGSQPVYKAIRIRATDEWLFDHPLFKEIATAVKAEEDAERKQLKGTAATAAAVAAELQPTLARIEQTAAVAAAPSSEIASTAIAAAASAAADGRLSTCARCKAPWFDNCRSACREPDSVGHITTFIGGCPCFTSLPAGNSRCRDIADALGWSDWETALRLLNEWPDAESHSTCRSRGRSCWLHVAVGHKECPVKVIKALLARGSAQALEVIDDCKGKPIAYMTERVLQGLFPGEHLPGCCDETAGMMIMQMLIESGANIDEPCTPQAHYDSGRTPRWLAENAPGRDDMRRELLRMMDAATAARAAAAATTAVPAATAASPTPLLLSPASAVTEHGSAKKRKSRDEGPGLHHAGFTAFDDVRMLWDEYATVLRPRNAANPSWLRGNAVSRDKYNDKAFFYREIASQATALGGMDAAIDAVQTRLNAHKKSVRSPGWSNLLAVLKDEQRGERARELDRVLANMSV